MFPELTKRHLLAGLLASVLFTLGMATGVGLECLFREARYEKGGPLTPEDIVETMCDRLDLTDEQEEVIEKVIARRWVMMADIFKQVDPQIDAVRRQVNDEIRPVLSPEQRRRFDALVTTQEKRRTSIRKELDDQRRAALP